MCRRSWKSQFEPDFHEIQDINQQHVGIDARHNYFSFRSKVKVTGAILKKPGFYYPTIYFVVDLHTANS